MNARASARIQPPPRLQVLPAEPPAPPPPSVPWSTVGVLLAIAVQTFSIIWWASGIDHRVASIERTSDPLALARIDQRTADMDGRLKRLEDRQ